MRGALAFSCYVTGTAVFLRFFLLVPKLRKERVGRPRNTVEDWLPWLGGEFTSHGASLRRHMHRLIVLGWLLLILGFVLSPT